MPEHQLPSVDSDETSVLSQMQQKQDSPTLADDLRQLWKETTQAQRDELYEMMDVATRRDPQLKEIVTNFYLLGIRAEKQKQQN